MDSGSTRSGTRAWLAAMLLACAVVGGSAVDARAPGPDPREELLRIHERAACAARAGGFDVVCLVRILHAPAER